LSLEESECCTVSHRALKAEKNKTGQWSGIVVFNVNQFLVLRYSNSMTTDSIESPFSSSHPEINYSWPFRARMFYGSNSSLNESPTDAEQQIDCQLTIQPNELSTQPLDGQSDTFVRLPVRLDTYSSRPAVHDGPGDHKRLFI
jgi:hypothetical protein